MRNHDEETSPKKGGDKNILYCSFCGKSQHEILKLVAGPCVFICDECIELCMDIIAEKIRGPVSPNCPICEKESSKKPVTLDFFGTRVHCCYEHAELCTSIIFLVHDYVNNVQGNKRVVIIAGVQWCGELGKVSFYSDIQSASVLPWM